MKKSIKICILLIILSALIVSIVKYYNIENKEENLDVNEIIDNYDSKTENESDSINDAETEIGNTIDN